MGLKDETTEILERRYLGAILIQMKLINYSGFSVVIFDTTLCEVGRKELDEKEIKKMVGLVYRYSDIGCDYRRGAIFRVRR